MDLLAGPVGDGRRLARVRTAWTPTAGHWAFQATTEELAQHLASMPTGLDVLVSHFPPRGFGDCVRPGDYSLLSACRSEVHIGSAALLGVIDRGGPGLVVYGHIHEDRGQWMRGNSVLANVTVLDGAGVPRYPGMAFEFDVDDRTWRVCRRLSAAILRASVRIVGAQSPSSNTLPVSIPSIDRR